VNENTATVTTVVASDPEGLLVYAIAGGHDAARFAINQATGVLRFVTAPDHDAPADAGGDNVYEVVVSAGYGALSDTQALTVTVGNLIDGLTLTGGPGGDVLDGSYQEDTLNGLGGNDTLNGKGGADAMTGGAGDDVFHVDSAADRVTEGAAEGASDRILASVSYTQGAGVFVERLDDRQRCRHRGDQPHRQRTRQPDHGNAGANVLDGRGGNDTLAGLGGDDWYYVDNAGDAVIEGAGEGANDRIFASVSYTLGAGVQVEKLTTDSNARPPAINLTGNELAN
jgi:Ca2+-binding RTX toxin-like protein